MTTNFINMDSFWTSTKLKLQEWGPSIVATMSLLPGGLTTGYMYAAFVIERSKTTFLRYGPFLLGLCVVVAIASLMLFLKQLKRKVIFCHFQILVIASILNIIGSGFYFAKDYDVIGGFLTAAASGLSIVACLSYHHAIAAKEWRAIFISGSFIWFILGLAAAVSTISSSHSNEAITVNSSTSVDTFLMSNLNDQHHYFGFAWLFIWCALLVGGLIIAVEVFNQMNLLDYETMRDEDLSSANMGETIFANRDDVIKRVRDTRSFFYVTKNQQWITSLILIVADAIYEACFIYFVFWFTLNKTTSLTGNDNFGVLLWVVLLGCAIGTALMYFFSVKRIFVCSLLAHIVIGVVGIILYASVETLIPFWFTCILFGISYSNIKIFILETSHFLLTEVYIFMFYATSVISICVINSVFITNPNSYFYTIDRTTLTAQCLTLLVIASLLAMLIALVVPKTFKTSLLEIQYKLLGIIFTEHQIEQLNIGYLNDGRIPTIQTTQS